MQIKLRRRHFVWTSMLCCIANFLLAAILLGTSIHNVKTKKRHVSHPVVDDWIKLCKSLICFSSCVLVLASFSMWGISKRWKRKSIAIAIAIVVLAVHLIAYIFACCLMSLSSDLIEKVPLPKDELFNSTKKAIAEGAKESGKPDYVPIWLDEIQTTKNCCGIQTFRDWNELWVPQIRRVTKDFVPKSCCRKVKDKPCINDLSNIPFPDTVSNNINIDSGCEKYVNNFLNHNFKDTYKFVLLIMISLGVTLFKLGALYIFLFFCRRRKHPSSAETDGSPSPAQGDCKKKGDQSEPPSFPTEDQDWRTLNFFPNKRRGSRLIEDDAKQGDTYTDKGSGSTVSSLDYNNSIASSQGTRYSNASGPDSTSFGKVGVNSIGEYSGNMRSAPATTRSISNALDKVERELEEMIFPYNDLTYKQIQARKPVMQAPSAEFEEIDQVESSEQTEGGSEEEEEYFPQDDIASPPAPKPSTSGAQQGKEHLPDEYRTVIKHHKHHRIQVKGISSRHHHGRHSRRHHKDKAEQEEPKD